jgi:hypothetical protein
MDPTELRRLLTATEHQITQGEILIQNQRWRIQQIKRDGENIADAEEVLRSLLQNQIFQHQHRTKLKRLLGEGE